MGNLHLQTPPSFALHQSSPLNHYKSNISMSKKISLAINLTSFLLYIYIYKLVQTQNEITTKDLQKQYLELGEGTKNKIQKSTLGHFSTIQKEKSKVN